MEINKQLFEDVLSGKLKGTFLLRNKQIIKSTTLKRSSDNNFPYKILIKYDNGVTDYGTFKSNGDFESLSLSYFDIVDFIPDTTDMKENELTIEIPNNKVIDWDEPKKQNKIILKDKQLTYAKICKELFNKDYYYFIDLDGSVGQIFISNGSTVADKNNASTKHQLECILAKNQLANVAKYLNSLSSETAAKYYIYDGYVLNVQQLLEPKFNLGLVMFKSKELAQQAIEILGEETIKLALEPLGV